MAKIVMDGIEEYANRLSSLFKDTEGIVRKAVFRGAAVVADEIKNGLKSIPTIRNNEIGTESNPISGVTKKQKSDLIEAFGLAPIENKGGYIQTKAGVDGYGSVPTKKYPNGVPNAMLMRSVESGTSFRRKTPVFRPAVNRAKEKCVAEMKKTIDEELEKIIT